MNRIVIALLCAALCGMCSCRSAGGMQSLQPVEGMANVTLSVRGGVQNVISRAADDNSIADVNLYVVSGSKVLRHVYTASATLKFACPAGKHTLYILANHHADMGDLDYSSLSYFALQAKNGYADLPMIAVQDVEIKAGEDEIVLPTIELRRAVAKINYDVAVSGDVQDIEIKSVQLARVPTTSMPFYGYNTDKGDFADSPAVPNTGNVWHMEGEFYMLPNLQGEQRQITTAQQKNRGNAPINATYLRIRALRGDKVLDYSIYLGENDTYDFNIRANSAYLFMVLIRGDNEADVRVQQYTVDAECATGTTPEDEIYLQKVPIKLTIGIDGQAAGMGISCQLRVTEGNTKYLRVNGIAGQSNYPLSLENIPGNNFFDVTYLPPNFSRENARLSYTVDFYDKYGYVKSYSFSYTFARVIKIYTKWYDGGMGYGTVSSPDAFATVRGGTLSSTYYLVYCPDEGCTLVANASVNRYFNAWYKEYAATGKISEDHSIFYTPETSSDTIYAYFL